jgi:hypothetical protein
MSVPIDQDIEEWRIKIRNTDLCGIVQCHYKPTIKCKNMYKPLLQRTLQNAFSLNKRR